MSNDVRFAGEYLEMLEKLAWARANDKLPLLEFDYNEDHPEDSFFDCCGTNRKCERWSLETAIENAYNKKFGKG